VAARDLVFRNFRVPVPPADALEAAHLLPAIARLQARHQASVRVEECLQYGSPPPAPDVSIIIPLFRRIDFLEHQLAQFVHDEEMARTDILYVLDSPELAEALLDNATQLSGIYRLPFRVVVLNKNAGFAAATNIGASWARGRLLLLLNSDVLPDRPAWLGTMTRFYDATPDIGALGPKLLFEDDSLQHAGLYFLGRGEPRVWENKHYFKGLHRTLPAANIARPVPAVTGACLMISRARYEAMGGLPGMYIQGDYEDSDLCLRLIESGYRNWYLPAVELYHLEGQSYPDELRERTRAFNTWVQTHRWGRQIHALMAGPFSRAETVGPGAG